MSRSTSATRASAVAARRRRQTRAMAVDMRPRKLQCRNVASTEAPRDWRDGLIPFGVIGMLSGILAYHHATLADALGMVLWR